MDLTMTEYPTMASPAPLPATASRRLLRAEDEAPRMKHKRGLVLLTERPTLE